MRIAKYFILGLIFMFSFANQSFAKGDLIVRASKYKISYGEVFNLTIEYKGGDSDKTPNFDALKKDFDILGKSTSYRTNIINGDVEISKSYNLSLTPLKKGKLKIPAFEINNAKSKPIVIKVLEPDSKELADNSKDVFMKAKIDKKNPFIQEEIILTLKLYDGIGVSGEEPKFVKSKDFIVEQLGDYEVYQKNINSRPYRVFEFKYALYPQKSGKLEIPSIIFDGKVDDISGFSSNNAFDFGFSGGSPFKIPDMFAPKKHIRTAISPIEIEVKPIPKEAKGKWWLPAKNIELAEIYEPKSKALNINETLTRKIVISAEGLTASQLPKIKTIPTQGLKEYPEQAKKSSSKSKQTIVSSKQKSIVYIPSEKGEFEIKPIEVYWWDTKENKLKLAKTSAKKIMVNSKGAPAINSNEQTKQVNENKPFEKYDSSKKEPVSDKQEGVNDKQDIKQASIFSYIDFFAGVFLGFVLFWLFSKVKSKNAFQKKQKIKDKISFRALEKSFASMDLKKARNEILKIGRKITKDEKLNSIKKLGKALKSKALKLELEKLEKSLYSNEKKEFDYEKIISLLKTASKDYKNKHLDEEKPLPELYPK